jgi:hypothetical protein
MHYAHVLSMTTYLEYIKETISEVKPEVWNIQNKILWNCIYTGCPETHDENFKDRSLD